MAKYSAKQKEEAKKTLLALFANKPKEVCTILRHVSSSGMTRHIDIVLPSDGSFNNISYYAAIVMDNNRAKDGSIKVSGCGMDMGFNLVYNLMFTLFGKWDQISPRHRWL